MRRALHSFLVSLLLASLLAAPNQALAAIGTAAPEFTLPTVPGGPTRGRFRMADHLRQRPVVVLFWATWCQPCLQELGLYQSLYQRYPNQFQIVAISVDGPDTISEAGATARRLGLTFPVVSDLETQVTAVYNPRRGCPFSVWVDHTGTIVWEREGFSMAERARVESGIANLVARRPIAAP